MPVLEALKSGVDFTPDDSVHVHEEGAIRLICSVFRSHDAGLPEWFKNSSDAYLRADVPPSQAVIVLLLRDGNASRPSVVGCLDFGGMTTEDIEKKFRHWADPEAAGQVGQIAVEGGHGNGGKCYMTQMFESHSYLHTLKGGRANRYGFTAGNYKPGFFPNASQGRGYAVSNPKLELETALSSFGMKPEGLPNEAIAAFEARQSFTLVVGFGAKGYANKRLPASQWLDTLRGHQQMAQALQRNRVYAIQNGKHLENGRPVSLPIIEPKTGAEAPRIIPIPLELSDGSELVATGATENSRLILKTSDISMRYTLKSRHTITGWTIDRRSTGYWEVNELSRATYANKIYGEVYLDALAGYRDNARRHHVEAPLTNALRDWIAQQIEDYSSEFVKLDKLQASQEERSELSRMNEALNKWMNQFLDEEFGGASRGDDDGEGKRPVKKRPYLPRGKPAQLVLSLSHQLAGRNVTFRPSLDFIDSAGLRVRTVPFQWESSDWAVATVDPELNLITTYIPGKTTITAVCIDSGLRSNSVELEVLDATEICLEPNALQIRAGSRSPLVAAVTTSDGRKLQGVYLLWTEGNDKVAQVGSSGMVFGYMPGETEVSASDDQVMSLPAKIVVLEADEKGASGQGRPRILLSEIDDDPLGEESPTFNAADPPVHQRPQDVEANIWWINMASPLARRYIDAAKGSGAKSREWRVYHLERYIEIMVKIILTHEFEQGTELTFETMLRRWDEEAVTMQDRASTSLGAFLDSGQIPGADENEVSLEALGL